MSAVAYGGPPPGEGFLKRIERAMREGRLPDPRTNAGLLRYGLFGLVLGFAIGL